MTIKGVKLLPPKVTVSEALILYQKVAKIKSTIGQLNSELNHSLFNEDILQILSLKESVQSTRIEGTQVTFADMIDQATLKKKSKEVIEVQNYREALSLGVEMINEGNPISSRLIKQIHRVLMSNETRGTTASAGEFRKVQNFLGPDNKIENAVYIPVPANEIGNYMTNLEYYINSENHTSFEVNEDEELYCLDEKTDPLIKTAIIHAQFESIHPFLDGNGRLGRILIVLACMQDKLINSPVFFISEELEKERIRYYNRLNGVRGENPNWFDWIDFFLSASQRMADNLLEKLDNIDTLAKRGIQKINKNNSLINSVWLYTFRSPFCTAKEAANALEIAVPTARKYLKVLADLKLLEEDNSQQRNKLYVNYDLINIIG
ncbi:Fic family protein [Facklamia lactis]|uniref:Fic family protein n=1 Tax=Facklamia lactis TaxID=2749967 RepID=UPI0018CCC6C8|nr:Fic family protein [Facklamia lactis]MBG9979414.1 Fic family protein [Facklamia lactis]